MERTEIWMQRNQITHTWLAGMKNGTATLESSLTISCKLRMQLLQVPETAFLGIHPEK